MQNAVPGGALSSSVLVLNRFYLAVHVVSARRAFVLLYRDSAEVIHIENGQYANYDFESWCEVSGQWSPARSAEQASRSAEQDWVRAARFDIQVPRIIRLIRFERVPRQALRFNRRNLFARDGHACQYCGTTYPASQLSLDHVVPRSRGGETSWENVVCSCVACNTKKGGRTPVEARMKLLRQPAKPRQNPQLALKLGNPKYESWRSFLPGGGVSLDVG
ncbi:MAG: HNH endonuclease [Pirellulaceae bacterium]|nr:HNH endonuclease [Pirellulaceae bacterium]